MIDEEIRDRLKPILMKRLTFVEDQGARMRRVKSPDCVGVLKSLGCEVLRFGDMVKYSEDYIFVPFLLAWAVKVPRELAMKILVLGGLP